MTNEELREIIKLRDDGMTQRDIAKSLGLGKSTVGDFLRKETHLDYWDSGLSPIEVEETIQRVAVLPSDTDNINSWDLEVLSIATTKHNPDDHSKKTHFVIPDTQCKPGVSLDYLTWVGKYLVNRMPDVIIHLGDHADMPSLSIYDKGKKKAEGKRVSHDIAASIHGMNALLKPLYDLQQEQLATTGKITYKPVMVLCLGNHEERILRHVDANAELSGFLSIDNLRYDEAGWEVQTFLKPKVIDGVAYAHFMANPMTGKPYGGAALNILKQVGESFTVGHKQTLDVATRFLPASGKQQWAVTIGACYMHDEGYKGPQGNHHFRGMMVCHDVSQGSYTPMMIDLAYLERRYGTE